MGANYWVRASLDAATATNCIENIETGPRFSIVWGWGEIWLDVYTDDGGWITERDLALAKKKLANSFFNNGYCGFNVVDREMEISAAIYFRRGMASLFADAIWSEAVFRVWLAEVFSYLGLKITEYELECC